MKKTFIAIDNSNNENISLVKDLLSLTFSKIDKAVQKGILHSNNGDSKKSSLTKAFKRRELLQKK
jgi:small subunit ribosomal protein S20